MKRFQVIQIEIVAHQENENPLLKKETCTQTEFWKACYEQSYWTEILIATERPNQHSILQNPFIQVYWMLYKFEIARDREINIPQIYGNWKTNSHKFSLDMHSSWNSVIVSLWENSHYSNSPRYNISLN